MALSGSNISWLDGIQATPLLERATGEPQVVASVTDPTDLNEALRDLESSRREVERGLATLRGIIEATDASIFSVDREYRYTAFNRAHAEIMRRLYGAEIVLGQPLSSYQVVQGDWAIARVNLDRALAGEAFVAEAYSGDVGRGRRYFEVSHGPIRAEDGEVIGAAVLSRDLTERLRTTEALRESEERLRQAQKMEAVGRLAGGVAHDFNNLLTVILNASELGLESAGPDPADRADMEDIRTAARRAQALTRQLLAFSRKQVLRPQPVNLGSLVQEVERLLVRLLGEDVDVVTRLAPGLRPVLADPGQLEQVLLNLAVNARDAMPRGGKLVIETRAVELDEAFVSRHVGAQVGPHAMLAISDTGCGMDAATLARVFEPFFTTKPQGKGTGLGLSTVYGIVKQSGGSIWAYSEVDRGTTFKVYLPYAGAPAPVTTEGPGAVEVRARPGEAVLVVEDDEAVRRSAVRCLEQLGYGVASASGLDEAVALARDGGRHYSALLSDVVMPGGSGMEVAQRVSLLLPGLPVIFMSGYTDDAISHHGLIAPGSIFLEKPFTLEAIGRTIREAIDRSGPPGAERGDDRRADRGAQGDGATLVPGTGGSRPGRP